MGIHVPLSSRLLMPVSLSSEARFDPIHDLRPGDADPTSSKCHPLPWTGVTAQLENSQINETAGQLPLMNSPGTNSTDLASDEIDAIRSERITI